MAKIKVKITVVATKELQLEDWSDEWQEYCDENDKATVTEDGDGEEETTYPNVSAGWVLDRYQTGLEEGMLDLSEELENGTIDVQKQS